MFGTLGKRRVFFILLTIALLSHGDLSGARIWAQTGLAESAAVPEGYADHICDSPQNLTGTVPLQGWSSGYEAGKCSVTWDGGAYAAAWASRSGSTYDIVFARVAADGTLLAGPVSVSLGTNSKSAPSIAWSGNVYGIAWREVASPQEAILFAEVSAGGVKIGGDVVVSANNSAKGAPSLVWSGTQFAMAWDDARSGSSKIYFNRVSEAGIPSSEAQVTTAGTCLNPSLAASSTGFGLSWDGDPDGNWEIYFALLTSTGTRIAADVRVTNNSAVSRNPSLAWTGTQYGVAWEDERTTTTDIYFARVSAAGAKLGSDVQMTTDGGTSAVPSLVWTGSEFGVAWLDSRNGGKECFFARVSQAGAKVGSDLLLTYNGGDTPMFDLAFGTLGYGLLFKTPDPLYEMSFLGLGCHDDSTAPSCPSGLAITGNSSFGVSLTWEENGVDRETEIAFHRVYRNGSAIGVTTERSYTDSPRPAGTPSYRVAAVNANAWESTGCPSITAPVPTGDCGEAWTAVKTLTVADAGAAPILVWDGAAYGAVWKAHHTVMFARISSDGALLVPPKTICEAAAYAVTPSLAWTGSEYGVVWSDTRFAGKNLYFTRVDASGNKVGADIQITFDTSLNDNPSLAWNGEAYGVSWEGFLGSTRIYFALLSAVGAILEPHLAVSTGSGTGTIPSLVWTGANFAVAWQDTRNTHADIYKRAIGRYGALGTEIRITTDAGNSFNPSLAWTGSELGLAWEDTRTTGEDIYFARVSETGGKQGSEIQVTSASGSSARPRLVWTGSEYGVVWQENRDGDEDVYYATLDASGYRLGEERKLSDDSADLMDLGLALAVGGRGLGLICALGSSAAEGIQYVGLGCGSLDTTPPPCPSDPSESGRTSTTVTLAWGPSFETGGDFGHYAIYKDGAECGATVSTTWTDASFDPSAGPVYHVLATNAAGYPSAGCPSVDTADHVAPACPYGLSFQWLAFDTLQLFWMPSQDGLSGLRRYRIYRNYSLIATADPGFIGYTDTGVSNTLSYIYEVIAEDWAGNLSTGCAPLSTEDTIPPACPSGLSYQWLGSTSLQLFWYPSQDAGGGLKQYKVYRDSAFLANAPSTALSYVDADTVNTLPHHYLVLAEDWSGNLSASCEPISTEDITPPSCPGSLQATAISSASVTLSWLAVQDPGSGLKQYKVYRDAVFKGNVPAGTQTYTDATVVSGTAYLYTVMAEDWAGNLSSGCTPLSVTAANQVPSCGERWTDNALVAISSGLGLSGSPSAAWDGAAYGVAWRDGRDGNNEIYFARVSTDGSVVVPATRITDDAAESANPSLAWTGTEFGVAWEDGRTTGHDLYFARISPSGVKIGPDVQITSDAGTSLNASLAWTGTQYGVAWQDTRTTIMDIYFCRISAAGVKIGSDMQITSDAGQSLAPSLAWTGTEYGVAWGDTRSTTQDIYFARISSSGAKIGSDVQITSASGSSLNPSLAWNGTEFGAAWHDNRTAINNLYFVRISASGAKVGSEAQVTDGPSGSYDASLAWSGDEYGLAWRDFRSGVMDIFYEVLNSSGAHLGEGMDMTGGGTGAYDPVLAAGASGLGLFWSRNSSPNEIRYAGIGCGAPDTTPPPCPSSPAVAARTETALTLAWGPSSDPDGDFGHYEIYKNGALTAFTMETAWTDPSFDPVAGPVYHVVATNAAGYASVGCPAVTTADTVPPACPGSLQATAVSGTSVTLSWLAVQDIGSGVKQYRVYRDAAFMGNVPVGTQITTDTTVVSGTTYLYTVLAEDWAGNLSSGCEPVSLTAADSATCGEPWTASTVVAVSQGFGFSGSPSAVWDGAAYGIVWQDDLSDNLEIFFARVSPDGAVLVPPTRVTNDAAASVEPAIAWNGTEFGVVWQDARTTTYDIYFTRIETDGAKAGGDIQITTDAGSSLNPCIVWTGTEYGLVWEDTRTTIKDLYFVRLAMDGTKLESETQITSDAGSSVHPSLAWTQSGFGLAWEDSRDGNTEIYFSQISAAGTKVGSDTRITNASGTSEYPSLAWTGSGYGVAWKDARTTSGDIYFAAISAAGAKTGIDVQVTGDAASSYDPSLVWLGTEYGVAWRDNRSGRMDIFYASLDGSGARLGNERDISGGEVDDYRPVLAAGGHGAALVYRANVSGDADEIRFVGMGCGAPDTTPPPCPSSPTIAARTETTIALAWGPSSDPDGDFGHYAITKDGALAAVTLETAWTDTSFDPAAGPVYRILATNAAGAESTGCSAVLTADTAPPSCPGNLMATAVSSASVTLLWLPSQDAESGLKQYAVYRDDILMITVPAGTTNFTDGTVADGSTYSYSVLAEDWAGNFSAGCASVSVTATDGASGTDLCGVPWTPSLVLTTSANVADTPSVAWDGTAYGVAWMDNRDGNYEIYFAKISADGVILVPPTRITNDPAGSFCPSLVWTGSEFGVAWYDQRTPTYDIYFARIALDGAKIGADVQITHDPADSTYPSLVWTGAEYGVAWKDTRTTTSDIYFARISAAGAKVGGDVQITSDAGQSDLPSLVWADTQYGVAWYDTRSTARDIYFALISTAGVKTTLDVQITSDPDESYGPSLAWTGSEFGVAWYDTRGPGIDIYFARVSSLGEKVGSDVPVALSPAGGREPCLVWKDTGYSLTWEDSRTGSSDIFFASLDAFGTKIGADRNLSNSGTQDKASALARGGNGLGLVYRKDITGDELHFVGLGCGEPDATPPPCPSSPAVVARTSTSVTLAWGPSSDPDGDFGHYAIYKNGALAAVTLETTWTDASFVPSLGPVYHVLATNAAGVESAGCPAVSTADTDPPTCPQGFMATAVSGSSITLAWIQAQDAGSGVKWYKLYRNDILVGNLSTLTYTDTYVTPGVTYTYLVRAEDWAWNISTGCDPVVVTAEDAPVACGEPWTDAITLAASSWAEAPSAAWDGQAFGVAWRDDRDGNAEIYFSRVTASGTVLVPPTRITYDTSFSQSPSLVWAGSAYGLAWTDGRTTTTDIYFTRINTLGNKLMGDIQITSDASISDSPSLVWTGNEYGVAWTDNRLGNPEIYFTRIDAAGAKLGTDIQLTGLGGNNTHPSLAYTGNQYAVAWVGDAPGNGDIYFARVSNYGIKIGSDLRVTYDLGASRYPSLIWTGTEFGLAWDDDRNPTREIYFTRISATGDLLGSLIRVSDDTAASDAPSLAWKDGEYLVAWSDWRMGRPEVFVASLNPGGTRIGSERRLTSSYDDDVQVRLAPSGYGIGLFYKTVLETEDQIRFMGLGCGAPDTTAPTCPGYLTIAEKTAGMLTLSWMASVEADSDFSHYTVYKDGAVATRTLSTTWTDWSFDPSAGSVYLVTATNAAGLESPDCALVSTEDTVPPTCVDGLMATVTEGPMVMLNWIDAWDGGSGIYEYRIYRNGMFLGSRMPGANMYMDMPGPDAAYSYIVEAVDWAGNQSSGCSAVWVYTGAIALKITKDPDSIHANLDWNDVGLSQYVVYRSASPQVGQELKRVPLSETQDPVLQDGVNLWYYIIQQRE